MIKMEDRKIIEILSDLIRETQVETKAIREETAAIKEETVAIKTLAFEAGRKADAAWELVILTRNQVTEQIADLRKPWWKKLVGA